MIWRGASQPHLRNELQGNALWRWTWAEVENESIGRWWKWSSSDFRGLIIMSRSKISISQPLNWGDDAWGADSEIVPLSDTPNNKLDQKHNNHYRGTIISSREPPTLVNELGSAEESLNENNKLSAKLHPLLCGDELETWEALGWRKSKSNRLRKWDNLWGIRYWTENKIN